MRTTILLIAVALCMTASLAEIAPASWSAAVCTEEASAALAAVNESGETLIAWGDSCDHEEGVPLRASAQVAIGTTKSGFTDLGAISPPDSLSYPTGALLDKAGNGWVVGLNEVAERGGKYDQYKQENTGVWFAFRPAGGTFGAPTELPTGGSLAGTAFVAGNRAGTIVLAWTTSRGSYVAWGTPTGRISSPHFFGNGLQIVGISVDGRGRALIIGYTGTATQIVTITGRVGGPFSRLHTIASGQRNPREHLVEYFNEPLAAISPNGNALIAWETNWEKGHEAGEFSGPTELVDHRAGGRFDEPIQLATDFLGNTGQRPVATVDGGGGAIIIRSKEFRWEAVALTPNGHIIYERRLPQSTDLSWPSLAGNEHGRAVVGWAGPCKSCIRTVLMTNPGTHATIQTFATQNEVPEGDVTMTIDVHGTATAIWVEGTPTNDGYTIDARAITPRAQTVQVAEGPSS
jgi:hypothetical protein